MRTGPLAIIFDVEGTLVDCIPQTLETWRTTLQESGHRFHLEQLQAYSGMDGGEMLRCLLPGLADSTIQQLLKRQGRLYRERYLDEIQPFPDVRGMFEALRKAAVLLGIATTCKRDELVVYDKALHVLSLTDAVVCGDEVKHGKPYPDLFRSAVSKLNISPTTQVVAVGDTPYDAKAAVPLAIETVGVLTGGFSGEALEAAGCSFVIERVREVVPLMASRSVTPQASSFSHAG